MTLREYAQSVSIDLRRAYASKDMAAVEAQFRDADIDNDGSAVGKLHEKTKRSRLADSTNRFVRAVSVVKRKPAEPAIITSMVLCPYCTESVANTDDHVFPQFLGGSRKIPACGPCNHMFGHTFEAAVARMLEPAYVQLAKLGVPLPERERWWNRAYEVDGVKVDLGVGSAGIKARSSYRSEEHTSELQSLRHLVC